MKPGIFIANLRCLQMPPLYILHLCGFYPDPYDCPNKVVTGTVILVSFFSVQCTQRVALVISHIIFAMLFVGNMIGRSLCC